MDERLKEIEARRLEIRNVLEDESKEVDFESIKKELDDLESEEKDILAEVDKENQKEKEEKEARKVLAEEVEKKNLGKKLEEKKMNEEKRFTLSSPEYRSAWAKKLMNLSEDKFTEDEKRALGDAITTTATTFVASTSDVAGVNNGGLLIPTTVREDILKLIEKQSPFFNDIRKLQVNGNIDLPFLDSADDAAWYAETSETNNEGQEYKQIQLTGWELAKDVVVKWKLEEMAVESFVNFIIEEVANKMGRALCTAVLNGTGNNQPKGALNGLSAITTGATVLDCIMNTYASLNDDAKVGAKAYISPACGILLYGYAGDGNYPFLQGIKSTALFEIEVDPYITGNDILVGNPQNYILNEVTPIRVDREKTLKGRKTTYGGYGVFDGAPKNGAFAKGTFTPSV